MVDEAGAIVCFHKNVVPHDLLGDAKGRSAFGATNVQCVTQGFPDVSDECDALQGAAPQFYVLFFKFFDFVFAHGRGRPISGLRQFAVHSQARST